MAKNISVPSYVVEAALVYVKRQRYNHNAVNWSMALYTDI